jgi:translation initiation factor 2 subunit 1
MADQNLPEIGEIVVCIAARILDYGVFVELLEYGNRPGFIHISEIASRWTKNIRTHVKEKQVRAAKVLAINREKGQIDLSLTKVSAETQRAKIEEWKRAKRAQKFMELLSEKEKKPFDLVWKEVAVPLMENHETLYDALQEVSIKGKTAAKGVQEKWLVPLEEIARKNIELPQKTISGVLQLSSAAPNGVELIKKALSEAEKTLAGAESKVYYIGSGKYSISVTAQDYKSAERKMNEAAEAAIRSVSKAGGAGKIEEQKK